MRLVTGRCESCGKEMETPHGPQLRMKDAPRTGRRNVPPSAWPTENWPRQILAREVCAGKVEDGKLDARQIVCLVAGSGVELS